MIKTVNGQDKDGLDTKMLSASSDNIEVRTQLIKDKHYMPYSLNKGTYKMTYDYLVPESKSQELYILYNVMVDYKILHASTTDYTSGRKLITENLLKDTTKGDTWVQGEIIFILDEKVNNIGFGSFTKNTVIYLDNVVITPCEEVFAIDFENHSEHDESGVFAIKDDPVSTEHGKTFSVSYDSNYDGVGKFTAVRNGGNGCSYSSCSCASTQPIALEAAEYTITYDYLYKEAKYKTEPGSGNNNYVRPENFSFKFAYSNSNDALAVPSTAFGEEIVDTSKATDTWH